MGEHTVYAEQKLLTGRKLAQDLYTSANVLKKRSDYRGEWFYESDTLRFTNHEEGRALPSGNWVAAPQIMLDPGMTTTSANFTNYSTTNITMSTDPTDGQTRLKVVANQLTSSPGFTSWPVRVVPGRSYTLKVKGYNPGAGNVVILVGGAGSYLGLSIYPGPSLPVGPRADEAWVQLTFNVPLNVNSIVVGLVWQTNSGFTTGSTFYVNDMELYEYNGQHGNNVFSQTGYEYQYHLKDHLGNVRMTFTTKDEVETTTATLEADNVASDKSNYLRYDLARRVKSALFDHTRDNLSDPIGYSVRLNGSDNEKIGLAKSLSVMPGDVVKAQVFAKYVDPQDTWTAALATLLNYVANPGTAPAGTVVDGTYYSASGATSLGITPVGHGTDTESEVPKAYLNYIFINRNFDLSSVETWYERIDGGLENGSDGPHDELAIERTVKEAGYVYVYLSNDGEMEVYFDDFKVEHVKSPVISSQDYFPFGLAFGNYQRENSLNNQYQYNGKELQEELNVGWLDYGARMYMPEIGRWSLVDRHAEKYYWVGPYVYAVNNPLAFIDPDGNEIILSYTRTMGGVWEIRNIHDLGQADPRIGFGTRYNEKTKSIDVIITVNIVTHNLFTPGARDNLERQNPGLEREVMAHEESHGDQFFETAISGNVSVSYKGANYVGAADAVLTNVYSTFQEGLKSDVDSKIKNNAFKTQSSLDAYVKSRQTEFRKEFDRIATSIYDQMQAKIWKVYDKSKMTKSQEMDVENDANRRANKKLGGQAEFLYGRRRVRNGGQEIPLD